MTSLFDDAPPADTAERLPPQDLHAEVSTLGGMLLSKDAIPDATEIVKPGDYYRPAHETIHRTIVDLWRRGEPADPITVSAELTKRGELDRVGGVGYVHGLASSVPTAANTDYYAAIVHERAVLRRLVEAGTRIAHMGYSPAGDADDVLDRAVAELQELTQAMRSTAQSREKHLDDMLEDFLRDLDGDVHATLPLPWMDLDVLLRPEPGDFIVVAARPGVGKSVILLDIARHVAIKHHRGARVSSMEMSHAQLTQRILAAEARVGLHNIRSRELTGEQRRAIDAAVVRIAGSPLVVDDSPAVPISRMRGRLRQLAALGQLPDVLCVDYLQIMKAEAAAGSNRTGEVDSLARGLKELAQEFRIVVIAAAQLNRQVEQRADKVPTLADLRESGQIEAEANAVVLLFRPDAYDKESPRAGELDLIVAKNRQGAQARITVAFAGHYSTAIDMAADLDR